MKISNKLKVPRMLLFIKLDGLSIDLSTCVSAAKLKTQCGLYFQNNFLSLILLFKSHFSNLYLL